MLQAWSAVRAVEQWIDDDGFGWMGVMVEE